MVSQTSENLKTQYDENTINIPDHIDIGDLDALREYLGQAIFEQQKNNPEPEPEPEPEDPKINDGDYVRNSYDEYDKNAYRSYKYYDYAEAQENGYNGPPGLVVLYGTHCQYMQGNITYRQLLLLAIIDRFTNHYGYRRKEFDEYGKPTQMGSWTHRTSYIARLLCCTRFGLIKMIEDLMKKGLIDTWIQQRRGVITLQTPDKKRASPSMRIPFDYFDDWRGGRITGPALILLCVIGGFWWKNKDCFAGDGWLGDQIGIKSNIVVNRYLKLLEDNGYIERHQRIVDGKPKRYISPGCNA